jgi:hypothetical protein
MASRLNALLEAGLIENLGGDDDRFNKMERAAKAMAKDLDAKPSQLIRAILVGLDPDIPADDPTLDWAKRALVTEWKSMGSVYPSTPVTLLRALLLDACEQAGEGRNAAILWLTAADTLPLMRLGKEEGAVRDMVEAFAERTEQSALMVPAVQGGEPSLPSLGIPRALAAPQSPKLNREALPQWVAATVGPNHHGKKLANANPHALAFDHYNHTNFAQWSSEFADRMATVLADLWDSQADEFTKQCAQLSQQLNASQEAFSTMLISALTSQQRWMQGALEANSASTRAEQTRLNALWWSEALYSATMHCSYRELSPPLAAVMMALDLLDLVTAPTPASVAYLLAESVNRLPGAAFEQKRSFIELLKELRALRDELPKAWAAQRLKSPSKGRLSLRDVVFSVLREGELDINNALARAGISDDLSLCLPDLARAVFRQEQAVQLARSAK